MKNILISFYFVLCGCYKLLDRKYASNNIDIHVGDCPVDVDHVSMLFNAVDELTLPGNYRHINWYFDSEWENGTYVNNKNEILFTHMDNDVAYTEFQVAYVADRSEVKKLFQPGKKTKNKKRKNLEKIIVEFDMIINPYGLTEETLYNVILHEMTHVFLLDHGEYEDSLSGITLRLNSSGDIIQYPDKQSIRQDDCYGIYQKMIDDILNVNKKYAENLETMKSHCENYRRNEYIII